MSPYTRRSKVPQIPIFTVKLLMLEFYYGTGTLDRSMLARGNLCLSGSEYYSRNSGSVMLVSVLYQTFLDV